MSRCHHCNVEMKKKRCPRCDLYNAACVAASAAAEYIAKRRHGKKHIEAPWLNVYGIYAYVDGINLQVGSADEAKPFCDCIDAASRVHLP
jgi:hypothetical protein